MLDKSQSPFRAVNAFLSGFSWKRLAAVDDGRSTAAHRLSKHDSGSSILFRYMADQHEAGFGQVIPSEL